MRKRTGIVKTYELGISGLGRGSDDLRLVRKWGYRRGCDSDAAARCGGLLKLPMKRTGGTRKRIDGGVA